MSIVVLCVDKGNSHLSETAAYLQAHDCRIYPLQDVNTTATENMLREIEEKEGKLDLLLLGANNQLPTDGSIEDGHDDIQLLSVLDEQIYDIQNAVDAALPLLRKSDMKRIGMITDARSSVSYCRDDRDYGQHMVLAGLNMMGKIYFNLLRPEGFTFRWYCADDKAGGMSAGEYLLTGLCYDPKEPYIHSDENRLVMRDRYLREIPW